MFTKSKFFSLSRLAHKYKDDERIGMISGNNFFENEKIKKVIFFLKCRDGLHERAWQNYDVKINLWKNQKIKNSIKTLNNDYIYKNYQNIF